MTIENNPPEMTPTALKTKADNGDHLIVLDVREPDELLIAKLEFPNQVNLHIPMRQLADRLSELIDYKEKVLVVYCRSGGRSGRCVQFLQGQGFNQVFNLTGGILSWSDTVDPSIVKY